jgi:hypothetical protein
MKEMELVATEFRIFFKADEEEMIHLFGVKKSTIPEAGNSIFAAKPYATNEVIGAYAGKLVQRNVEKNNVYCMLYSGDPKFVTEVNGVNKTCHAYFGAHMMNHDSDRYNTIVDTNYTWITTRAIGYGEELFLDYNLT